MEKSLLELSERIGVEFSDQPLFKQALTHSSYINEHRRTNLACNERLEYLGDAVLELVVSEFLYRHYPDSPEGELSKIRAGIVCEPTLAHCAESFGLGAYLLLGRGEEATGGRKRASVVSDAMEALIGALYLDGGFAGAKAFIERFILDDFEHKVLFYDSKTTLQEMVQAFTQEPLCYELVSESGPDHDKTFSFRVLLGGRELGRGSGRTKKAAEAMAAYQGILALEEKPCT